MAFNKSKYDIEYIKKNKKKFAVDLNISEYDELEKVLKENDLTKVQFVRNAFKELKEKKEGNKMKFIKGKYEKILREHENIKNYKYEIGDYYLQYEQGFLVSLNQIIFDEDWKYEDLTDVSIDDYTEIKEICKFNIEEAKNITITEMKKYIENQK